MALKFHLPFGRKNTHQHLLKKYEEVGRQIAYCETFRSGGVPDSMLKKLCSLEQACVEHGFAPISFSAFKEMVMGRTPREAIGRKLNDGETPILYAKNQWEEWKKNETS